MATDVKLDHIPEARSQGGWKRSGGGGGGGGLVDVDVDVDAL